MTETSKTFDDVVIGGGAVGLWAALTRATAGRSVCVVDAAPTRKGNTYAVPLHPGTLDRLRERGLLRHLDPESVRIDGVAWWRGGARIHALGSCRRIDTEPAALCVAPLDRLEAALEAGARAAGVTLRRGQRVERLADGDDAVRIDLADVSSGTATGLRAGFVIAADGCHSSTRAAAGIDYVAMGSTETYLVFEGPGPGDAPSGIEVLLHDGLASSVWPLAGGRWRGNLRVPPGEEDGIDAATSAARDLAAQWLAERSGGRYPGGGGIDWLVRAPFELRLVDTFCRGRILIAGDAAHSAGPTAAHSMNRGFVEVEALLRARDEGAETLAAADARIRADWGAVFGVGSAAPRSPIEGTVDVTESGPAGWPVNWIDTVPASGADLEMLLEGAW